MVALLLLLISQDGLGVRTVEASEVLQRKPHFAYRLPEWVTDHYLFALAGFLLDEEIEKCIDATTLTLGLGGKPLSPAMVGPFELLGQLKHEEAMKILEMQLGISPAPEVRRQILLYRITGDWMGGDLDAARRSLKTLQADREAAQSVDLDFLSSLLSYWKKGEVATSDSLLYFLLVERDPEKALKFLPDQPVPAQALRYHLNDEVQVLPEGSTGRFLRAHRLLRQGRYQEAEDSLKRLSDLRFPYQALSRYDMAAVLLERDNSRKAHLAVPDSFPYQWLLPQRSLALMRGRVEWAEERPTDAKRWLREAHDNVSFDLYAKWVTSASKADPATETHFVRRNADELYRALRVADLFREGEYERAVPILEKSLRELDVSGFTPLDDLMVALYGVAQNEQANYQLVVRLADAVRERGMELEEESYFVTAAHLAVADAYYYAGGRYEDLAKPFYEYCMKSDFDDLRHLGLFGLGWSLLGKREMEGIEPVLSALREESLTEWESQVAIFLEGMVFYARRDFKEAAEVFSRLNFSSVPQMQMQGLYFEARSCEQSGRPELAASAYDDLLAVFPDREEVRDSWTRLVRAQIEMDDIDAAEKTLNRLIRQAKLHHFPFVDLYKEILLLIFDASMAKGDEEQAMEVAKSFSLAQNSTLPLEAFHYRIGERDTALWQTDHLIGVVAKLSHVNPQSAYLPPLLLQLARMEIELADYGPAIERLERIIRWSKFQDVSNILPEASYELIRAAVLSKDWERVILRSEIFMRSYPDLYELAPRVLFFQAAALLERAGNGEAFARKEDGQKAIEALNRLENSYARTDFVKESVDDIKSLRRSAELLVR